jgi:hypothetical protein
MPARGKGWHVLKLKGGKSADPRLGRGDRPRCFAVIHPIADTAFVGKGREK